MRILKLLCLLSCVTVFGLTMQGCSVSVVVAPHATFAVDSLNERNTGITYEEAPLYDCAAGPDADVCQ